MRTRRRRLTTLGLAIAILVVVLMLGLGSRPEGLAVSHAQSCGGTIRSGQTVDGRISRPGRDCRYTFHGNTGDVVTITMTKRSSSLDPYLSLLDPTGSVVASDNNSAGGDNSLISYTLRRNGTYTIVAGSYRGRSHGDFVLSLSSCGGTIRSGQTVYGEISRAGRDCRYTFSARDGDVVTIKMTKTNRSSSLDPYLSLLDLTGSVVASDNNSGGGGNSLISYTLRRNGTYTIVAGSYRGRSYGDFMLSLTTTTSCGGTIRSGQTVYEEISRAGRDCRYTFSARDGDVVTIKMTKTNRSSSLDPWLDLLDPSGRVVASDDDSGGGGNSLIRNHRLQRSGTYTIVAGSYQKRSAGPFKLELTIR